MNKNSCNLKIKRFKMPNAPYSKRYMYSRYILLIKNMKYGLTLI